MSKSLRIIIGVLLFISTISFAHSGDKFYLKTGVSLNKVLSEKVTLYDEYDDDFFYDEDDEPTELNFSSKKYKSFTIGLGYKITSFYNIEALFQYTPKIKKEHSFQIKSSALILNNIFSIPELINAKWPVKPYFGFGLGLVKYNISMPYSEEEYTSLDYYNYTYSYTKYDTKGSGTNFVWKATVGTVFPITKSIDLDLSYAYGDYGKFKNKEISKGMEFRNTFSYDFKAHEVFLGLRYKF